MADIMAIICQPQDKSFNCTVTLLSLMTNNNYNHKLEQVFDKNNNNNTNSKPQFKKICHSTLTEWQRRSSLKYSKTGSTFPYGVSVRYQ